MPLENTPDIQLWSTLANGGHGLASTDGDSTAGTTGFNLVKLYENTTDNPLTTTIAEGLYRPSDIVFDTVHGKFFIADSDLAGHNRILQGNIADLLNNPSGPPSLTILYSDAGAGPGTRIDHLEVDPNSGIVYFTHGDNFEKVVYDTALQAPTILFNANVTAVTSPSGVANPAGSTNNFYNDVAINFATGDVYLTSTRVGVGAGGDVVTKNFIYQLTGLTAASGTNAFTFGAANSGTARFLTFTPNDDAYNPNPGTTQSPANSLNEPFFFPIEHGSLDGLAIDTATNTLYISTGSILFDHDQDGLSPILEQGGIFSYALTGNPTGTYTQVFAQTVGSGPQGLLGDLEIDTVTGRWYVTDFTGGTTATGDEAIWTGNLNGSGTPTEFVQLHNPGGQIPSGFTINHAPTVAATDGGAAATETAGAGSGFSVAVSPLAGIDVSDFETADDADQLTGATVRISDGYGAVAGHAEQLTIGGTTSGTLGSGIAYSFNSGTGEMTLTGVATFAEYEAALALVSYSISGDNPDGYGAFPTREIAYSVSDGLVSSDEQAVTVDIAATNDAPVNTVGAPFAVLETDGPTAVTGLAVSDVDADPANDVIEVTLSATLGTIAVATGVPGGVTAGQVSGNGTGTVTITATQNAINATFADAAGVTYDPATDGIDNLTMTTSDLGNGGAGGAQQDVDAVVITVINVNQDPTAPATNSVSTDEDTTSAATPIGADDPDDDTLTYSEKPGFEAANGTVTFDQLNGTFTYDPDPDFFGPDSFTILIEDGLGGETEQVVSVTVNPVNDDPPAPATNSASAAEDGASAPTAIGADDVENDTLTYSEKAGSEAANGSVSFDQVNGTFTYTPDANFNGSDSFTILIEDGNGGETEQVVSVTVSAVNDAPTVAGDGTEEAPDIVEDTPSPTGQTVSALFGGQYSDATDQVPGGSSADAFAGVAVTANGSSPATGQWQYHNGVSWVNIGAASTGSAVLLSASTAVRFNPASGFVGNAPTLTTHLVDASGGAITSGALADLSVTGGTTAYSTGSVVLSQEVLDGNSPPTGVTGTLAVDEFPTNGTVVGTVVGQDPDSAVLTYVLVNDAGGRFDINATTGQVTVQDGLLIDFEQQSSHTIRVEVTDDQGESAEFDMVVAVQDVHGEIEAGDGRGNVMVGGAETDIFTGNLGSDTLSGGGGSDILIGGTGIFDFGTDGDILNGNGGIDILYGGGGNDTLNGGAQADLLIGGNGNDVFVFQKGEANGDVVLDFDGNGASAGDSIVLQGYAAGTTFTRIGGFGSDLYQINDHGFIEYVTIMGQSHVHASDVTFV